MRLYEVAIIVFGGLYFYGRHKQAVASNVNQQMVTPVSTTIIPAVTSPIIRHVPIVRSPKPVQQATQTKYPSRIGGIVFETNVEPGTAVVLGEPEDSIGIRATDNVLRNSMRPTFSPL